MAAAEPDPVAAQGGDGAALRLHRAAQGLPQQPGELGRGEAAVVRVDRLGVLAMEVWQRRDERIKNRAKFRCNYPKRASVIVHCKLVTHWRSA